VPVCEPSHSTRQEITALLYPQTSFECIPAFQVLRRLVTLVRGVIGR
jgi:hypothetical protein